MDSPLATQLLGFMRGLALSILAVLIGMAALGVAVGALLWGLGGALWAGGRDFWQIWQMAHRDLLVKRHDELPAKPSFLRPHPQPAFLLYFYGTAWDVIRYIVRHVWGLSRQSASQWTNRAEDRIIQAGARPGEWREWSLWAWAWAAAGGFYGAAALHYGVMALIVAVFSAGQAAISLIGAFISSVVIALLSIGRSLVRKIFPTKRLCPYLNCQVPLSLPSYLCPQCGRQHDRLQANAYGIFYHRCYCGERLAAWDQLGRANLACACPHCQRALPTGLVAGKSRHLGMIGGDAAGKTSYLNASLQTLISKQPQRFRWLNENLAAPEIPTDAQAYLLQVKGWWGSQVLYCYDAPLGAFASQDSSSQQRFLRHVEALLFMIDPFSLDQIYEAYQAESDPPPPHLQRPEDVLGRVLAVMADYGNLRQGIPVAVVISKIDRFDLAQKIKQSADLSAFLREYGAASLMLQLKRHFKAVDYFAASILQPNSGQWLAAWGWLMKKSGMGRLKL